VAHGKKLVIKKHNKNEDHVETPDAVALLSVEVKERSLSFTGRQHDVPVLVAPKSHLRPASELMGLIYPHLYTDLVDGDTALFCRGGGETEERERYVAKTSPDAGGRARSAKGKTNKHMG
jgi:hypothetical protein